MSSQIHSTEHIEELPRDSEPIKAGIRAPLHIRYSRGSHIDPKLVSIGPYHHKREHLKGMEDQKLRCTLDLFRKRPANVSNLDLLINQFAHMEMDVREFYREKFFLISSDDFVRMMVIDSCFVIRIIIYVSQHVKESMAFLDVNIKEAISDMLVLENQLPFFFIEMVYDWLLSHMEDPKFPPFHAVLEPFLSFDMPWPFNDHGMLYLKKRDLSSSVGQMPVHLLDLYWKCCLPPDKEIALSKRHLLHSNSDERSWVEIHIANEEIKVNIQSATILHQTAGIEFQKIARSSSSRDEAGLRVTFQDGIMMMPRLKIDSSWTTLLINLVAFEYSKHPKQRIFTSYMKLMDALIDSEKDIELLQQSGVIQNTLSSHTMAATFFNDTGHDCFVDDCSDLLFSDVLKDVQKAYESNWNHRWASLRHNHFSNPWAGISVVAGTILLLLSAAQTFFTVYDHYKPNKP